MNSLENIVPHSIYSSLNELDKSRLRIYLNSCEEKDFEMYLSFAAHAAVLPIFSPDILYYLRENFFLTGKLSSVPLPYFAISDFILSPICKIINEEVYTIYPKIKTTLRNYLVNDALLGLEREIQILEFIYIYLQERPQELNNRILKELLLIEAQFYLDPKQGAKNLLKLMNNVFLNGEDATKLENRINHTPKN